MKLCETLTFHQGMLTVTSEVATTAKLFLNLWKHECNRVIADRFTNQQDKDWFEKALKQVVEEDFDAETANMLDAEPYFVDFMRDAPEPTGMGIDWTLCLLMVTFLSDQRKDLAKCRFNNSIRHCPPC